MHMSHQHMHAGKITSHSIYNADMHMHESYLVSYLVLRVTELIRFFEEGGQLTTPVYSTQINLIARRQGKGISISTEESIQTKPTVTLHSSCLLRDTIQEF